MVRLSVIMTESNQDINPAVCPRKRMEITKDIHRNTHPTNFPVIRLDCIHFSINKLLSNLAFCEVLYRKKHPVKQIDMISSSIL